MAITLRSAHHRLELVPWHETRERHPSVRPQSYADARLLLRSLANDTANLEALRRVLRRYGSQTDLPGAADEEMLDYFARLIAEGRMRIRGELPGETPGGGTETPPPKRPKQKPQEEPLPRAPAPPPRKPAAPAAPETTLSWIKFKIVDDETGEPMSGVKLKIKLPDGSVQELTTDGQGMIHVTDIPSGSSDIQDMFDDDALEVVGLS